MICFNSSCSSQCAWLSCVLFLFRIASPDYLSGDEIAFGSKVAQDPSQQRNARQEGSSRLVYRDRVIPHWFANNTKFWYRNDLRDGKREFILVDAENGKRTFAFDHESVARKMGDAVDATQLPIDRLEFNDDSSRTMLIGEKRWEWISQTKELIETKETFTLTPESKSRADLTCLDGLTMAKKLLLLSKTSQRTLLKFSGSVRMEFGRRMERSMREQQKNNIHSVAINGSL